MASGVNSAPFPAGLFVAVALQRDIAMSVSLALRPSANDACLNQAVLPHKADAGLACRMSAKGHKRTLFTASLYVRFAPESGHSDYRTACAISLK